MTGCWGKREIPVVRTSIARSRWWFVDLDQTGSLVHVKQFIIDSPKPAMREERRAPIEPQRKLALPISRVQGCARHRAFRDFGDEVHLWFEQRVPWSVALEILRELKAPSPALNVTSRPRPLHLRASKESRRSPQKRGRPRKEEE